MISHHNCTVLFLALLVALLLVVTNDVLAEEEFHLPRRALRQNWYTDPDEECIHYAWIARLYCRYNVRRSNLGGSLGYVRGFFS